MSGAPTIYLASRTEDENHLLSKRLSAVVKELAPMNLVGLHPRGLPAAFDSAMALVVFNFSEWGKEEAAYVINLRNIGYIGPMLILTKGRAKGVEKAIRMLEPIAFLEKPFDGKHLVGIVRKMLVDGEVAQQAHRRYSTEQDAEVEFFEHNDKIYSRVCNLSKGGAYLEFISAASVNVGQMLRLTVELKQLNRTYTMPAKVVWTKRSSPSGGPGIGVEFIGPGDVQRMIIG